MYAKQNPPGCKVVKKVTDRETFRCLKPATVTLIHNTPEPIVLCLDCARELVKEIVDSVLGGKRDITRKIEERRTAARG